MSEISPPSRPMMVHELYPVSTTSELRAVYATQNNAIPEQAAKTEEAYSAYEARRSESVERGQQVISYDLQNGTISTATSSEASSMSWLV